MVGTKKRTRRPGQESGAAQAEQIDPRAPLKATAAQLGRTIAAVRTTVASLPPPAEPAPGDLIEALMHALFAHEVPCAIAQEAIERVASEYVDRNEFRVTEAYETETLLGDLAMPAAFERCAAVRNAVNEIYADQNRIDLDFLREATVTDRKGFFQRVPAIPAHGVRWLTSLLAWDEIVTSPKSTQRVQQRVGLDPANSAVKSFVEELRALLQPFGHIPILVAPNPLKKSAVKEPGLCPACELVRLTGSGKS